MNQDVRKDHTMRNALLLAGGTAALAGGGIAGVKALEKNAKKITKDAFDKKFVFNVDEDVAKTVSKKPVTPKGKTEAKGSNDIKTKPNETKTSKKMSPDETQAEIEIVKKLIDKEEILLAQAKQSGDITKIAECQKMLSDLKQKLAKLGGFAN